MKYKSILILLSICCLVITTISSSSISSSCPCSDNSLCEPVSVGERQEFMGYSVNGTNFENYDFSTLTTIASFYGNISSDLMCLAHSKNVRVVYGTTYPVEQLGNMEYQQQWIQQQVNLVQSTFADGLNFDVETPMYKNQSDLSALYTGLVAETYAVFKNLNPNYQITVDVAWSPNCIDGRCYDYVGLSQASDYLIVMDYDMQSQVITDNCVADANSPPTGVFQGMQAFLDLGIDSNKLAMGLPWYGYNYPCIGASASLNNPVCQLKLVPFRGVNCSDAAGTQLTYQTIMDMIQDPTVKKTTIQWDTKNNSPFFNFIASDGSVHQMRYDNPSSLQYKIQIAKYFNLRGVAVWNIDQLGPLNQNQYSLMWDSLDSFFS